MLIYIADDDRNIRELMKTFLVSNGFEVKAFPTGDDLLLEYENAPSDMVILDISMPGTDGLTVCTRLREKSNVPIIIVSARDSEIDRITGITLGSDDYLTKPFSPMELVVRVKAIFRRIHSEKPEDTSEFFTAGNVQIMPGLRKAKCGGTPIELSPTEFALMTYIIRNKSRAVSREELLKNVWKFDFEVDTRATDDVIKRLRKKLVSAGATISIESVWGFGFKVEEM